MGGWVLGIGTKDHYRNGRLPSKSDKNPTSVIFPPLKRRTGLCWRPTSYVYGLTARGNQWSSPRSLLTVALAEGGGFGGTEFPGREEVFADARALACADFCDGAEVISFAVLGSEEDGPIAVGDGV